MDDKNTEKRLHIEEIEYGNNEKVQQLDQYEFFWKNEENMGDTEKESIKRMVGGALHEIPAVLAVKSYLGDIFKKNDDITKGIVVHKTSEGRIGVALRVVGDKDTDTEHLIRQMTNAITGVLQMEPGVEVGALSIQIVHTMSQAEFYEKHEI